MKIFSPSGVLSTLFLKEFPQWDIYMILHGILKRSILSH